MNYNNNNNNNNIPYNFKCINYRILNPDLNNFTDNELVNHYIKNGRIENREYILNIPADFNCNNYKILNSDLNNLSDDELKYHYIKNGQYEKREYLLDLPNDFDINIYRLLNLDLNNLSDSEIINHYIKNGQYEKRQYIINIPNDFNCNDYKILNPDLNNLSEIELKCHYITNGKNENRNYLINLPINFNLNNYKLLNPDLGNFSDDKLIHHFIKYGKDEKREYLLCIPDNFNVKKYRLLNRDLNSLTDDELIYHFIKWGKEENREYILILPEDFNYSNYRLLNSELVDLTDDELIIHFLNFKNLYKSNITKNFDYNIYKLLNNNCISNLDCEIHYYNNNLLKNYDKIYFIKLYILYNYGNDNLNIDFNNIIDEYLINFIQIIIDIQNISINELETYIMLEKYCNLNNIKFISFDKSYDLLLNNPEEHLRYLCYRYLNYLKNKKVKYKKFEFRRKELSIEKINKNQCILSSTESKNRQFILDSNEIKIEEIKIDEEIENKKKNKKNKKNKNSNNKINNNKNSNNKINNNKNSNNKINNNKNINNIINNNINENSDNTINNNINENILYEESYNETVLVEFDILYHLEFIIRNMINQFPDWKHTIICCDYNYLFILNICNNIFDNNSNNINIIKLDKNNNININYENYPSLLTSSYFWNLFTGKYILLYNSNCIIYKTVNFEKFLNYDYIGTINNNDNYFSIRNRQKMLDTCNNFSYNDYIKNAQVYIPEWAFFMNKLEIELPIDIVHNFLSYNIKITDSDFKEKFNNIIKKYYCEGVNNINDYSHRFGWNNVLLTLYVNDIITYNLSDINDINNTQLVDICEKYFEWSNLDINRGIEKWIGILHLTYNTPEYLMNLNIKKLLNNNTFILRLPMCNTLISLSNHLNKFISDELSNYEYINKKIIYHPINIINNINKKFNINSYLINSEKKIIQIGQQMRIFKSFLYLKLSKHAKIWLSGNINLEENINKLKIELNTDTINLETYNVEHKYVNNNEFDNLLINNIIFIHLYDSSANNTILEAISYKTPIIVNRCSAVEEYLGKDYPLYFNNIDEVNDNFISVHKIKLANEYLININHDKFSYKEFNQNILELI